MKNLISKQRSLLLTALLTLLTFGTVSAANSTLDTTDMVGVSFWLASVYDACIDCLLHHGAKQRC